MAREILILKRAELALVPNNWMGVQRRHALTDLQRLSGPFDTIYPDQKVSPTQYAAEMGRSKICLSPFGYGEICYRDYEAALHGCLLFKPDMSHVRSQPDIFRPYENYVLVNWHYSDLGEKVRRYAADQGERIRMVRNARRVLREALQSEWFVVKV